MTKRQQLVGNGVFVQSSLMRHHVTLINVHAHPKRKSENTNKQIFLKKSSRSLGISVFAPGKRNGRWALCEQLRWLAKTLGAASWSL